MIHRPVCSKCKTDMRPVKNGVVVVDYASFGPYEMRDGDEYACPECGIEVVVGFATQSTMHHDPGFTERLARAQRLGLIRESRFHA